MTTFYQPPPSAYDLMKSVAEWVARAYFVKVTFTIDSGLGDTSTVIIDRRATSGKEQKP